MSQKYAHLDADGFVIGFYDDEWHGDAIPADAVPIEDEHHVALLEGQSVGKRMKLCEQGLPLLVDHDPPTDDEIAADLRARRDAALAATDGLVTRHQEQILFGNVTTLSPEQAVELNRYRNALRDLPSAPGFPHVDLPSAPDFIGVK